MLAGEQRRRHDDGDLHTVHRGDEGRPQRHLGLAEADVAANKAVHRPAGTKVFAHGMDGIRLVVGLVIREAGRELVVDALRRGEHRRVAHQPRGGDLDEAAGHVEQAFLQLGLARLPGDAAELVEQCIRALAAVAREQVDVFDRQEEFRIVRIDEFEAGMRRAGRLDGAQADEAADAVLGMHDDRALIEPGDLGKEIRATLAPLRAPHHAVAQNVLLADDDDVASLETAFEAEHSRPGLTRLQLADIGEFLDGNDIAETMFGEHLQQTVERSFRPARHQHLGTGRPLVGNVLYRLVEDVDAGAVRIFAAGRPAQRMPGRAAMVSTCRVSPSCSLKGERRMAARSSSSRPNRSASR
jgi:hypothetical protein